MFQVFGQNVVTVGGHHTANGACTSPSPWSLTLGQRGQSVWVDLGEPGGRSGTTTVTKSWIEKLCQVKQKLVLDEVQQQEILVYKQEMCYTLYCLMMFQKNFNKRLQTYVYIYIKMKSNQLVIFNSTQSFKNTCVRSAGYQK